MRRVTRNLFVAIALVVVALLALGALPSYLGSGDPYYLTAEPIETEAPAVDVNNDSAHRYPFLTSALASDEGRSDPYQTDTYGIKESFTHTPFDEVDALTRRLPEAATDSGVRVQYEGTVYRVEVMRP
ncbi:hypothetical protein [Halorubrum sp. HHNYT27]|uniref:hypothetical protein n=1 Tax=Halorubrum sp. HHNYT27 TaxID=3402275 RepID=UPI003EB94402